jgi:hypothetical protein
MNNASDWTGGKNVADDDNKKPGTWPGFAVRKV